MCVSSCWLGRCQHVYLSQVRDTGLEKCPWPLGLTPITLILLAPTGKDAPSKCIMYPSSPEESDSKAHPPVSPSAVSSVLLLSPDLVLTSDRITLHMAPPITPCAPIPFVSSLATAPEPHWSSSYSGLKGPLPLCRRHCQLHSPNVETGPQKDGITCPSSHSPGAQPGSGFGPAWVCSPPFFPAPGKKRHRGRTVGSKGLRRAGHSGQVRMPSGLGTTAKLRLWDALLF